MELLSRVQKCFVSNQEIGKLTHELLAGKIIEVAAAMIQCFKDGHKVLSCGNGGSACDAEHFAGELVNRFQLERAGLPAIALSTAHATMTAIANDYSYADVFSKQVLALGAPDDFLLTISTSGNSQNILQAVEAAHAKKMRVVVLSGNNGGKLKNILNANDFMLCVPTSETPRIQEMHGLMIHIICDLIEHKLFSK